MLRVNWELTFRGRLIGAALRELHEEGDALEVRHIDLQIYSEKRPAGVHGVALALWDFALQRYREIGIDVVRVKADRVGAYVWAKTELSFADGWDANRLLKQGDVSTKLEDAAQIYGREKLREFHSGAQGVTTPRELVQLDPVIAKAVLPAGWWEGVLKLR